MAINTTVISASILTPDNEPARFTVSVFGIPTSHFFTTPGGGNEIRLALKRSKLEGYYSSPFLIRELYEGELKPGGYWK